MRILNEIFAIIKDHPHTGSSRVLAAALASACNAHYTVSLLDVSATLDDNGRRLVENHHSPYKGTIKALESSVNNYWQASLA